MAVIREESLIIKVSRLVKSAEAAESVDVDLTETVVENIETIVQELIGEGAVVEVEQAPTTISK